MATGSDNTTGFSVRSVNCILTFVECLVLVMLIISSSGIQTFSLSKVACKRLLSEIIFNSCLGYNSLDKGHNLLPEPPANIIPYIFPPIIF